MQSLTLLCNLQQRKFFTPTGAQGFRKINQSFKLNKLFTRITLKTTLRDMKCYNYKLESLLIQRLTFTVSAVTLTVLSFMTQILTLIRQCSALTLGYSLSLNVLHFAKSSSSLVFIR